MKKEYDYFREREPYKFTYINGNKIPLFRDALGLSSSQDWRYYKASLNINNKDVERFKSPFMYRPVKNSDGSYTIYILFYSIDSKTLQNLKEATFNITGKTYETDQNGKKVKNSDKKITGADLKAQIYKDFELSDYFEFIKNNIKFVRNGSKDTTTNVDEIIEQIKGSFEKIEQKPWKDIDI